MIFWIVPSNPEQFDVNGFIDKHRSVYWRQTKYHYNVGDVIFIYTTGGVGKIQYAMMVEQAEIPNTPEIIELEKEFWVMEEEPTEKVNKFRLLQKVDTDALNRQQLQENGLKGNVQGALTVKGQLLDYILSQLNDRTKDYLQQELKFGLFDSWVILSDNKIAKICDYSWFNNHGSSIPIDTRWYWGVEGIEYPDRKRVRFHIEEKFFDADIKTDNASGKTRTRLFWSSECENLFNKLHTYKQGESIYMLFEKEGNDTYKATFINDYTLMAQQEFNIRKIIETISATGLIFDPKFVERYLCSLITKPFVILSGLTGSGKTQLAMAFPKLICEDKSQYKLIPVGADWTNREQLLGYPNALRPGEYVMPDNGALQLILEASKPENQNKPYFIVLDEMNMSYVERYFADFLSAMESGEEIPLWTGSAESKVPATITLPKNIFIIGTINVDETTYMFSPKVLDRANVIEFRINKEQMLEYLGGTGKIATIENRAERAADFVATASKDFAGALSDEMKTTLISMFDTLSKIQKEFGYRTAHEMSRFITICKCFTDMSDEEAIDAAMVQKLLPKIHGSRKKISPVLTALWQLCYKQDAVEIDTLEAMPSVETFKYPLTAEKIWRMYQIAQDNGFTSFAEA